MQSNLCYCEYKLAIVPGFLLLLPCAATDLIIAQLTKQKVVMSPSELKSITTRVVEFVNKEN